MTTSQNDIKRYAFPLIAAIVVVAIGLGFFFLSRVKQTTGFTRMQMGTLVEIKLKTDNAATADKAFTEIDRLEKIFSSYKNDSEISLISKNAGIKPIKVSPEVIEVLETALLIAKESDGAFDPTIGVLGKLWGYSAEKGVVPDKKEVENLLPLVNYKNIEINKTASTVMLKKKGMVLNLGGIAKGYIVGKALDVLKANGIKWALIHAGGDMYLFQESSVMEPFIVGIKHPRQKDKLFGTVKVLKGAVSTSGDYERFFEKDGIRYHHILDPKTGFPARSNTTSVTVISENPALADALSTAVFVLGPDKGRKLVELQKNSECIIIDESNKTRATRGLEDKLLIL